MMRGGTATSDSVDAVPAQLTATVWKRRGGKSSKFAGTRLGRMGVAGARDRCRIELQGTRLLYFKISSSNTGEEHAKEADSDSSDDERGEEKGVALGGGTFGKDVAGLALAGNKSKWHWDVWDIGPLQYTFM